MSIPTLAIPAKKMIQMGLNNAEQIHYQRPPEELVDEALQRGEGVLNDTGALLIHTGQFTGRSPKDKFIVKDTITQDTVCWNDFNIPATPEDFDRLHRKMVRYMQDRDIWVRDCFACADPAFRVSLRVFNEQPSANLFCYNMFERPEPDELDSFEPEWQVMQAPGFLANPLTDGTRQGNFAMISFTRKLILIGGTAYTGEIKKGVFTILNFLLPQKNVLPMHCSANVGPAGDTAIFFGLSGTGKTTLSTDPERKLVGDDEHGWTSDTVFNFEGGCYAKCIDLSEAKEPEIYQAIRKGALVENVVCFPGINRIDFSNKSITENTRVSYPLYYIDNIVEGGVAGIPRHIFFLTCDAYGIFPPVSRLSADQAMYHFISGYTAKVAGTETGITEPKATFSTCFGAPFLPLHPGHYAAMLGERIKENNVTVWLINTGWTKGSYGQGERISLTWTRAMISAALNGWLDKTDFIAHPFFGMEMPLSCPGVPSELLNPRNTWKDKEAYDQRATWLLAQFNTNFEKYASGLPDAIRATAPLLK